MAVNDVEKYLAENEGRYPLDILVAQLRSAGYPEPEIRAAVSRRGAGALPAPSGGGTDVGSLRGVISVIIGLVFLWILSGVASFLFNAILGMIMGGGFYGWSMMGASYYGGGGMRLIGYIVPRVLALAAVWFIAENMRSKNPLYAKGYKISIVVYGIYSAFGLLPILFWYW